MKSLNRRRFMSVLLAAPAALAGAIGLGKSFEKKEPPFGCYQKVGRHCLPDDDVIKIGVDLAKPGSDLTVKYTAWTVDENGKMYPVSLNENQFCDALDCMGPDKQVTINIDRPVLTYDFGE